MGECYYHGGEVYPGHPCEKCQIAERISSIGSDEAWKRIKDYGLRIQMDLQKDREGGKL